jgi:hypothetical protein
MPKHAALSRNVDSKGRLTLGESFANRTVIVEERGDGEVLIRLARVVPEPEAWLYQNEEAMASVRRGLRQAHAGKFAKRGPDLRAAAELAKRIPDA